MNLLKKLRHRYKEEVRKTAEVDSNGDVSMDEEAGRINAIESDHLVDTLDKLFQTMAEEVKDEIVYEERQEWAHERAVKRTDRQEAVELRRQTIEAIKNKKYN